MRAAWVSGVCVVATVLISLGASLAADSGVAGIRESVGFDQNIGAQLPLDVRLRDASGRTVSLGDLVRDRPAVLVFGYFTCPQLCRVTANGVIDALREIHPSVGREFDLIYVSIDPADTPARASDFQARDLRHYHRGDDSRGWHYLTGEDEAVARVAQSAGFRYYAIAGTGQFAHASGFIVLRPGGVISRTFLGLDFRPSEVTRAIDDAAAGRNGESVFDLLLVCFSGDARGAGAWAFRAVQVAAATGFTVLAFGVLRMLKQERRQASTRNEGPPS